MKILFLDIDGVLNQHIKHHDNEYNGVNSDSMFNLNRIIKTTGCKLVISSAWRYMTKENHMTLKGFEWMLRTHGLICKDMDDYQIVGITAWDESHFKTRERQITQWITMSNYNIRKWCAIDDLQLALPVTNFVQTNGSVGLHFNDVERVIGILNG